MDRPIYNSGMNTSPLRYKIALVTGGSRGIGAAIVQRLAREGADVALTYSASAERAAQVVKEAEALGVRALAVQADSADPQAVEEAVERTARELGGLDILVNNAGVAVFAPLADYNWRTSSAPLPSTCAACSWPRRRQRA